MKRAGELLIKFSSHLLENRRDAVIFVSIFAFMFFSWLAVALVVLITLRKGKEDGFNILLPAMVAHLVYLMTIVPLPIAIINVLITFVPAYIAALVLRSTANWSAVFGSFFVLALVGTVILQILVPDAILAQYQQFQLWVTELPHVEQLIKTREYLASGNQLVFAHLFFGIQMLFLGLSAIISLLCARFIQAKLFLPGGFKKELSAFRSGKLALFTLMVVLTASYFNVYLAIDLLPMVLFYFLLSGLNLSFIILAQKRLIGVGVFIVSLVVSPLTMFFICGLFGVLDSLFNFRIYFFTSVKKSI